MKAILIDPYAQTVTEVDHNGDFRDIYRLLSGEPSAEGETPPHPVDTFDAVYLDDGDAIYVDDEGLFKANAEFFAWDGGQPLAGRGLILGSDDNGDSTAPKTTLADAKAKVRFGYPLVIGRNVQFIEA